MSPPCWWSSGCVRCWIDIWNKDDVSKIRDLNDGHPTNPMFSRDLQDRGPFGRWLARVTHRRDWRYNLANNKLTVQTYPFVQPTRKKSTLCNRRIPNEEPKLPWFIKKTIQNKRLEEAGKQQHLTTTSVNAMHIFNNEASSTYYRKNTNRLTSLY